MKINRTLLFLACTLGGSVPVHAAQTSEWWNWLKPRLTGGFFAKEGPSSILLIFTIEGAVRSIIQRYQFNVQRYTDINNFFNNLFDPAQDLRVDAIPDILDYLNDIYANSVIPSVQFAAEYISRIVRSGILQKKNPDETIELDTAILGERVLSRRDEEVIRIMNEKYDKKARDVLGQFVLSREDIIKANLSTLKKYIDSRLYNALTNIKSIFMYFLGDRLGWAAYEELMKRIGLHKGFKGILPALVLRAAFMHLMREIVVKFGIL